jgi:hypothetical protein
MGGRWSGNPANSAAGGRRTHAHCSVALLATAGGELVKAYVYPRRPFTLAKGLWGMGRARRRSRVARHGKVIDGSGVTRATVHFAG